ncbi:hypothetical protein QJS04_geneDACA006395 [Acorus gramineus]|uniref:Uncharacterized protein n=1 Tax=Acorus gramineus TaxID=55184 RepID=A0AAV9AUI1_ACOGR|nr:hypothetical protein QJS04_geneDACA006395 [Acorus gramineus]
MEAIQEIERQTKENKHIWKQYKRQLAKKTSFINFRLCPLQSELDFSNKPYYCMMDLKKQNKISTKYCSIYDTPQPHNKYNVQTPLTSETSTNSGWII